MANIVIEPTPDTAKVCDLLERLVHGILAARDTLSSLAEYEAPRESLNLLYLMIRNIEAVILLARTDLVLLPAAMNLTRPAFEMAMKTLWMLAPEATFDREARWLAQLGTEEDYYARMSQQLDRLGVDNSEMLGRRDEIAGFRREVTEVLPKPYVPLSQIPKLPSMMREINQGPNYRTYIFLSQYAHGSHKATGTYRRGLGNLQEFGEFISPKDWATIFYICWDCLARSSKRIFEILGGNAGLFSTEDAAREMEDAIKRIETSS